MSLLANIHNLVILGAHSLKLFLLLVGLQCLVVNSLGLFIKRHQISSKMPLNNTRQSFVVVIK